MAGAARATMSGEIRRFQRERAVCVPDPRYRLIVMDLDGTLLNRQSQVTPRTRAVLERAHAEGIAIAVATGRSYPLVRYFTRGLPLSGPQITFNGAIVVDSVTGKSTHLHAVPVALVRPVLAFLVEHGAYTCYFTEDMIYVREHAVPLERALVPPDFSPQPVVVPDLSALLHLPCIKLVVVAKLEAIARLRPLAEAAFGDQLYITQTSSVLLEFLHPAVSKGAALIEAMCYLGLRAEEVIAFGDSHNDIEMLRVAGTGVAMANAGAEVRAVADSIAPSNDDDGIAVVLEDVLWGSCPEA
jgi:Cof subfamily protein (haloacid dehalogenase superfamily)